LEQVFNYLELYSEYITLAIFLILIITLVSFIIVLRSLNKTKKRYRSLLKGVGNKNLEEIILSNAQKIEILEEMIKENDNRVEGFSKEISNTLRNFSIKRYNAFDGVGGEQSFSLALLNDEGSGFIITGIHGRDDSRTYAKPVTEGRSKYNLTEEEKIVLSSALYKNMKN
jgi:hypothetical protein